MENGQVEIHAPNNHTSSTNCDNESTSHTDSMEDTVELRLLMAYAKRRRPSKGRVSTAQNSPITPRTPAKTEKEPKKKEKKWKRLLRCIKPQTVDEEPPEIIVNGPDVNDRCGDVEDDEVQQEDKFEVIASRLTEISDEIPFAPPEVETDALEDDVEKVIGLLLREAGDRLDEELQDAGITAEIFGNYSFFKRLITNFLMRMGLLTSDPEALGPQASPKTQIAVTCEVTSRLLAVDTLPMARMLDHGARYLQDHYSSWARQHGGYEEVFQSDDEDVQ